MQHTTGLLIRKKPFDRFARAIAKGIKHDIRFKPDAINALQEAAEAFLIETLLNANMATNHAKRITINPADMKLAHVLSKT